MLTVDVHEKALIDLYKTAHVDINVKELEYGDVAISVTSTITIGVERKTINDCTSSIRNKRLPGHQLPGCLSFYQRTYLLLEGRYGIDARGCLTYKYSHKLRPFPYSELAQFLQTWQEVGQVQVQRTTSLEESARWLLELEKWWLKPQHTSTQVVYAPAPKAASLTTKMAAQIKGISDRLAFKVGSYFGSPRAMVEATPQQWAQLLEAPVSGKKVAKIIQELNHETK